MIIADTSVWVAHFRAEDTPAARTFAAFRREGQFAGMTDLVYAELLAGASDELAAKRLARQLEKFRICRQVPLEDHVIAAGLRRAARAAGTPVRGIVDCLIAAVCIRLDVPLLHDDRDFDRLALCSSLRVVPTGPVAP